jgi:hypothetical protein
MTLLMIEIREDCRADLETKARAKGVSPEQYVQQILEHNLDETPSVGVKETGVGPKQPLPYLYRLPKHKL